MMTPTQSRRYGRMVRDFTPDEAKAYNDYLLAGGQAENFFDRIEKHLAGQHDQSSHGSWAQGTRLASVKGGHNLTLREMLDLRKSKSDPLQNSVYLSEALFAEKFMGKDYYTTMDKKKPVAPKRDDFQSREEYLMAYKKYSKDHTKWARDYHKIIVSDLAKNTLNGTLSGVKKYVTSVIDDPWFVDTFGHGRELRRKLEIKTMDNASTSGQYQYGIMRNRYGDESAFSEFKIDTHYTFSEKTILHEIAHYATAISEDTPHAGHGVEFVKNYLALANHFWGAEKGATLSDFYVQEGVLSA